MRSFLTFMICTMLILTACKKENQASSGNLDISGFGAVAFASGDAISVYGSGFDPDPENNIVSFNGVNGEVATASPNRLQVIAPLLTTSGKITVTVRGKSVTSTQTYTIVNLLQGNYASNFILTADKKYLLRGKVTFASKLSIQAGTVIYGEKLTQGSLSANDVDFEGTAEKPIIFTSDQEPGSRYPGDWTGIVIGSNINPINYGAIPNGILQYVRVEYAGYHKPGSAGTAISVILNKSSTYKYLQASYSAGAGFSFPGLGQFGIADGFVQHIVAFGCMGNDFVFTGQQSSAQYGLGLKDPYFADISKSNGISGGYSISNFTFIGYNPDARNLLNTPPAITNDAGSGIIAGEFNNIVNPYGSGGGLNIYNSLITGSYLAGVAINGGTLFSYYELPNNPSVSYEIRNNIIAGTSPSQLPVRGGAFAHGLPESYGSTVTLSFRDISADPLRTVFAGYNDTTRQLSFSRAKDDLGIKDLANYQRLNNPGVLPAAGSILLKGASFPSGSIADNPYFNKNVTYIGAFGTDDWTRPWCNFNPQITQY